MVNVFDSKISRRSLHFFWFLVTLAIHIPHITCYTIRETTNRPSPRSHLFSSSSELTAQNHPNHILSFDQAVLNRFACKTFQRYNNTIPDGITASSSDPKIVQQALECLQLARLAPSSFNTQPYKIILVHSPEQKLALSKYCLGPNAQRVRDSDCTAVFLADRKILTTLPRFSRFLTQQNPHRPLTKLMALYIAIFSSGYPLPRILSASVSFLFRWSMSILNLFTRILRRPPLPTLSSSETWATKNAMLVAMTYMLACSARGMATIPMEGINGPGIRRVLRIPSRYAIPVVIATGTSATPLPPPEQNRQTRRYPREEVISENRFKG